MMSKLMRRLFSCALAAALTAGLCLPASAYGNFKYPSAYWKLHSAWEAAAGDPDQVISVAQKNYDLLTPLGLGQDVCENLEPKAMMASWACEVKGDIAGAITWAERERTYAKWLTECGLTPSYADRYDYTDLIQSIDARLEYLRAAQTVTVYARSDDSASSYAAGPRTGTWYGTPVDGSRSDTNAALMYVTFQDSYSVEYWIDYYSRTSESFRKAADGGVIEVAWNFSPENTSGARAVLGADSYIAESLRALGGLNATVLLRVGAEMNCWSECDPEVYKQAFRKVASAARSYSNIQMVFSPNDISNRNVTCADYYPGDGYVDWIGMSTYHNTQYVSYDKSRGVASYAFGYDKYYDDAFYGVGIYDHDPLITVKPIIDLAKSHNKPVMVSECGFSYRDKTSGQDLTAFASEQMNWFYSYINMVYPQVKAVFYFDTAFRGSDFEYSLASSPTLSSTYEKAIRENGAYLSDVKGTATGWTTLDKASLTGRNTLRLAAYASLPGKHGTTVTYYVDGKQVHSASQAPFYYDLDLSALGGGSHTLRVEAAGGQFKSSSQTYTLRLGGSAAPVTPEQPEKPAAEVKAMPTNDKLTCDGQLQNATVYKIGGSNFFKIRDLAAMLNGTEKQFSVGYDGAAKAVTATSGQPYEGAGKELAGAAAGGEQTAQVSNDSIYINGEKTTVSVYKIGGSNYFKLRDLGKALNFYVGYEGGKGMYIETDKPYE